ncbi:Lrp/AsnC family transcriptional regulator [Natronorarus salvus]|uniref:Lrp/AsnC family transcriptional regulator n=1 Tax=Natronorarus salvus TaxID=3117733 RepID=UPI002F26CEA9
MSVTRKSVLKPEDLNNTDESLLNILQEGRVTPTYAAEEMGVSREYASDRLKRLTEHGHVEKIAPGLYELTSDPRNVGDEFNNARDSEVNEFTETVEIKKQEIRRLREQSAEHECLSDIKVVLSHIKDELHSETSSHDRIMTLVEEAQTAVDDALSSEL